MKSPLVDQCTSLIVGHTYRVPTVKGIFANDVRARNWPILLPGHTDQELKFEQWHYHVDVRFVSLAWAPFRAEFRAAVYPLVRTSLNPMSGLSLLYRAAHHGPPAFISDYPVVYRRRVCQREHAHYPIRESASIRKILDPAYRGQSLGGGKEMKCPHRGCSLKNVPLLDGCRTCPMHGLRFNPEGVCVGGSNES